MGVETSSCASVEDEGEGEGGGVELVRFSDGSLYPRDSMGVGVGV